MYSLTITEDDYSALCREVLSLAPSEGAAYLLCGESRTPSENRLLVREVVAVRDVDYLVREPYRLSIRSPSYSVVAKRAAASGASILFVHSHPGGRGIHSPQDDREEPGLMSFFNARVGGRIHGSAVIGDDPEFTARVHVHGNWEPVGRVRIVGRRFQFMTHPDATVDPIPAFFDRNVRAFGSDLQQLLRTLHVGVVGAGGVGSIVTEQLTRLGVGEVSLFDHDILTATNVTRVYGSTMNDVGRPKASILKAYLDAIGLGTIVHAWPNSILEEDTAKELRRCDIVFGCTDKELPRAVLNSLALYYLLPVFDLGVKISSSEGIVESIDGRITVLTPGAACLLCRGRITPEAMRLEALSDDERGGLVREGYAPELGEPDPAVITFTTAVAAMAVTEFLNRFTNAIGGDSFSERLILFHFDKTIRTNTPFSPDCVCGARSRWGRGDREPFLDQIWSATTPIRSSRA